MNLDFHVAYRPQDLDEVIGQDHVIKSLKELERKKAWPHALLFVGGTGVGKTSLARIVAHKLGADAANILEIDAASNNGIDFMRSLQENLQYSAFGISPVKVIILDEVHFCSKPAWASLLKIIEEPPKHVYFMFCTTESDKVPDNIKTRCHVYALADVSADDIFDLIDLVNSEEKLDIPEKGLSVIANSCYGSPRRALTMLSKCRGLTEISEIRLVLQEPDTEEGETIELCRALLKGISYIDVLQIIKKLTENNPESIRLVILAYMSKVLLSTKTQKQAEEVLAIVEAFSEPFRQSEKMAPLLLALGKLLL
jgi:DNA polymerase-3 subunit gamma/tau